jgi:hypothetical protein
MQRLAAVLVDAAFDEMPTGTNRDSLSADDSTRWKSQLQAE